MDFKNFSELREFIRRYNSTSILEIGAKKCWQKWETKYSDPLDWLHSNTERNYAIRLMLLASAGNFHADKLADVWCRIHSAFEQIGNTVEALKLYDKPVIPLILTFYDSIAASTVFEEMVKQTDYCSRMGLNIPPIVHSIHEFEHWISERSLNNWAESILSKQNASSPIQRDNKGHNYGHLNNISIL